MLQVGSILNGTYKILNEIGHGGRSVVYLALNERANKTWAVKEVRKDGSADSEILSQGLVAETEMLKRLNHPNLPSIVDVVDTSDSFIIVMDYIEGRSLQSVLNHSGPQEPDLVLKWAKQICDVLQYLHSQTPPIIYRDMKPANVMLKPSGDITVIDFGTAREYKQHAQGDTTWLGTRGYAAPEQFGGQGETDARTDIYTLGATLYHLLTGYSPADTNFVIYPLSQLNPQFKDSGWEVIVDKCCQPRREDRYQSCAELMYDLEHIESIGWDARRARNRKWRLWLASCITALVGAAGIVTFTLLRNSARTATYDGYIRQAVSASNFEAASEYYQQAIELDPGDVEAYNALLETIDSDLEFDAAENDALFKILNGHGSGGRTNIDRLARTDEPGYAEFVYHLANDYYFFYSGSDNRVKAASWYERVMDSDYLTPQQRELARSLNTIGNYYASLSKQNDVYSLSENSQNYGTFWAQLVDITDDDVVAKTGGTRYAAALYYEFASQIYSHATEFRAFGVTQDQMMRQLTKLSEGLAVLQPENDVIRDKITETKDMISMAERQVTAAFTAAGTN